MKQFSAGPAYRMGAALLDLDDPSRLIARLPYWLLGPMESYEVSGDVPNVIFSCGHLVRDDELWVYYGAADSTICLATAPLSNILDALREVRE